MAKIVLAEDDASMRRFIASTLTKAGHEVLAYPNGREAYESLQSAPCDLLLTDIVMPEMDGVELSKQAKTLYPTLDILFITGFVAGMAQSQESFGQNIQIIQKPFHLGKLIEEVNKILALKNEK